MALALGHLGGATAHRGASAPDVGTAPQGTALSGASAYPRAIDFANSLGGLILTLCRFQVAVSPGVQRESGALEVALARSNEQTKQVTIGFDFAGIAGPCMALSMLGIPYKIM